MAQAAIKMPELVRTNDNMFRQRPAITDGGNTILAGQLVRLTSGALVACATDEVLLFGSIPGKSLASTDIPPVSLPNPVGESENHNVFDPTGGEFEINVGALSANALVIGASAKTPADVSIGTSYGIANPTAGAYIGFQVLDPTETTATLFTAVAKVDGVPDTELNGRVRVRPIANKIQ